MLTAPQVQEILFSIALQDWYRAVHWNVEHLPAWNYKSPTARFRIEYMEPDVVTGIQERQCARWWYVEQDFTPEAVIKSAWLALTVSDEHRRREAFAINGIRIFDPHQPLPHGVGRKPND